MVQFFVPGKPIGKQRPKFNKRTKNTYTPKETRDYEALVKQCYMQKYRDKEPIPAKTPVEVEIYAYFKIPKSMPKKQVKLIENNKLFPTVKPDSDNISKIILDALNGVAYYDDNQVTDLTIYKQYATTNEKVGVVVNIREKRLVEWN